MTAPPNTARLLAHCRAIVAAIGRAEHPDTMWTMLRSSVEASAAEPGVLAALLAEFAPMVADLPPAIRADLERELAAIGPVES